jgi:hypothetical protein
MAYGRQIAAEVCRGRPARTPEECHQGFDHRLTELFWRWLTPNPAWIRRWCSWQSWRTRRDLQHCQLGQEINRPGWKDRKLQWSFKQTVSRRRLKIFSKCPNSTQYRIVSHFWACCDHFHEIALKYLLFLTKFSTTLLQRVLPCKHLMKHFLKA